MKTTRRTVLGLLAGAAAVAGVPSYWIYRMKTYAGPPSDHFDGTHFFDPDGVPPKSLGDVLRWQSQRIRNHLPPKPQLPTPQVTADLDFIHLNALARAKMRPAVTWIGHATMLVQASGLNVLTDPVFSTRASPVQFAGPARAQAPGIEEIGIWQRRCWRNGIISTSLPARRRRVSRD